MGARRGDGTTVCFLLVHGSLAGHEAIARATISLEDGQGAAMTEDRRSETPPIWRLRGSSQEPHAKAQVGLNEKKVASLIGKHILVGVTFLDSDGDVSEQQQVHGSIRCIDPVDGMVIAIHGSDKTLVLPPDLSSVRAAPPGEYRLRSTGEVVVDPDFLCTWIWREAD